MKISCPKMMPALVAFLALGFLSGGGHDSWRKIACVDPTSEEGMFKAAHIPIEMDLFAQVRTEAEEATLKKGALDFYNFLSQNELKYYLDSQAAFTAYGVKSPLFANLIPTPWAQSLASFGNLGFSPGPQLTNLWGTAAAPQAMAAPALQLGRPIQTMLQTGNQAMAQPIPMRHLGVSAASNSYF